MAFASRCITADKLDLFLQQQVADFFNLIGDIPTAGIDQPEGAVDVTNNFADPGFHVFTADRREIEKLELKATYTKGGERTSLSVTYVDVASFMEKQESCLLYRLVELELKKRLSSTLR